jgi:hypothetical protein
MTNDEIRMTKEAPMINLQTQTEWHHGFYPLVIAHSFGIRAWALVIPAPTQSPAFQYKV